MTGVHADSSPRLARTRLFAFPNDGARTAATGDLDPSDREGLLALLRERQQHPQPPPHGDGASLPRAAAAAAAASGSSSSPQGANPSPGQQQHRQQQGPTGRVYLVGTGPGDPGLLTLRAAQLVARADVVLYDRLVSDDVLALAPPSALLVYAGKAAGLHTRPQGEIHALLAAFAEAGATVVRLKGGDPFVFGRGGEEAAFLAARGVEVRAVPGVTAAAGIAAELGVPLTHRGVATGVRFLTGHAREGGEAQLEETVEAMLGGGGGVDEAAAAAEDGDGSGGSGGGGGGGADEHTTLVVYMGLGTLPALAARLTGATAAAAPLHGGDDDRHEPPAGPQQQPPPPPPRRHAKRRCYCPSTPAVAVERGTTDEQRVVFGTLADLSARAASAQLRSPTLIVIGRVVALSPLWEAWEARGRPWPLALAADGAAGLGGDDGGVTTGVPCARADLGDPLRELGLVRRAEEEEEEESEEAGRRRRPVAAPWRERAAAPSS